MRFFAYVLLLFTLSACSWLAPKPADYRLLRVVDAICTPDGECYLVVEMTEVGK